MWKKKEEYDANEIIDELYEKAHGLADKVIESVLNTQAGKEEREDLMQDGFMRLLSHVDQLAEMDLDDRIQYMCKVMRNIAIDKGRKYTVNRLYFVDDYEENDHDCDQASDDPCPEELMLLQEENDIQSMFIGSILTRMEIRDRILLVEKYINQKDDKEIGKLLGMKPRNVRSYLSRAKKKFREIYYQDKEAETKGKTEQEKETGQDWPDT